MTSPLFSSITQSVLVSVNDLESEAIREQRRFLLTFSKKVRDKQSYGLILIETIKNKKYYLKATI